MLTNAATTPLPATPDELYIGGSWESAASLRRFDVHDPATGQVIASVSDADDADAMSALDAATGAQRSWAATPARERAELLRRAFDRITDQSETFATLITTEMGKPLAEARAEVAYGAEFLRWFSEEACRIDGGYRTSPGGNGRIMVARRPVGPCLFVLPWNFPLAMGTRKIAPALAAGCTVVVKPSDQTPLTMLLLAQVLHDVGLPPGVVNVLPTSDPEPVVGSLLADARLRKLSFTGSTGVGQHLLRGAAQHVLRCSMELGGNAPLLVLSDADIDLAIEQSVIAKMRNIGESCIAANRLIVHRSLHREFADGLADRLGALRLGHGLDPDTEVGPLINDAAVNKVGRLVRSAVEKGARVLTGGDGPDGIGHFYSPTVLDEVPAGAPILQEEVFGPVAPIVTVDDDESAIQLANATPHGLAAYVFSQDLGRVLDVVEQLEVGMVGINRGVISDPAAPFGGVKASGLGREGGREGIEEYVETMYVALPAPGTSNRG